LKEVPQSVDDMSEEGMKRNGKTMIVIKQLLDGKDWSICVRDMKIVWYLLIFYCKPGRDGERKSGEPPTINKAR
jgi:hypothetical protein